MRRVLPGLGVLKCGSKAMATSEQTRRRTQSQPHKDPKEKEPGTAPEERPDLVCLGSGKGSCG